MSSTEAPLTDDEFSKRYCSNGGHKIIFPDNDKDRGPVGLNLDTFLNSRQLQSVENLHIVMKLFWVPELDSIGYLQGVHRDRAHLQTLQRVLNKLIEAKAGRDGPLLRSLTLEDLSDWEPYGRRSIKGKDDCLAQYRKTARDAGVEDMQWKWPSGLGSTTRRVVEVYVRVNVEKEDARI